MDQSRQIDGRIIDYKEPEELERIMDFSLPDQGVGVEGIFPTINQTLQYSVNTFSPRFMDKLYAGTSPIGVMAELLLAGLNGNSHVYHVSPVFTLMEIHVTRALANLFGFTGPLAGGLSCPGGSASNQMAMVTARNAMFPEIKSHGYFPQPSIQEREELEKLGYNIRPSASTYGKLIAFTSSAGHYSLEKSAVVVGLGTENIVGVPCNSHGAMIASELERLIQEHISLGHTPFFINATAGTTVLGAFDPIRQCGEIAKKYNCWLHVDGSWGGCTVFVPELANTLLDGTEMAQSITINPHKMLQTSLQCSLLLVQDSTIFPRANALKANYLFHGQSHDLGDGTLGCGRRSDAIKLFLSWKYYGKLGFQARIEKSLANVKRLVELLAQDDYRGQKIQMLRLDSDRDGQEEDIDASTEERDRSQPSHLQVCFWYRPQGSRLIDWRGTERVWRKRVEQSSSTSSSRTASATATPLLKATNQPFFSETTPFAADVDYTLLAPVAKLSPSSSSVSLASLASVSSNSSTSTVTSSSSHGLIISDPEECQEAKAWMERVVKAIHARIRTRGEFMIDYAPFGAYLPVFFRVVLNPPTIRDVDLVKLVEEILLCGDAVTEEIPIPKFCREKSI
ncbi:hypothetical protein BGZ46_005540 [Entomortierella lignicola]|nr:hypothetical protein BGZ46_005540 [Entomortierella lignicola]